MSRSTPFSTWPNAVVVDVIFVVADVVAFAEVVVASAGGTQSPRRNLQSDFKSGSKESR